MSRADPPARWSDRDHGGRTFERRRASAPRHVARAGRRAEQRRNLRRVAFHDGPGDRTRGRRRAHRHDERRPESLAPRHAEARSQDGVRESRPPDVGHPTLHADRSDAPLPASARSPQRGSARASAGSDLALARPEVSRSRGAGESTRRRCGRVRPGPRSELGGDARGRPRILRRC